MNKQYKIENKNSPKKKKRKIPKNKFELMEDKFERNRDKRVERGFSSTGVPLPTFNALLEYAEKKKRRRIEYYKNHSSENKKSNGKFFIDVCMGGQNKKY